MGKKIFLNLNRVYSDGSELDLSDETISISIESSDEKNSENYHSCYVAEKRTVFKLSKISILSFDSPNWRLERRLCQISRPYLLYFSRNKPSKSVTVWPVHRFKWFSQSCGYKTLFQFFFRFVFKVLELFECSRGDPYMTANRNFVRFAQT